MTKSEIIPCDYPEELEKFKIRSGKHVEVGKLIEKWVIDKSSRPGSPKKVADALRPYLEDLPANASVHLRDWNHNGAEKHYDLMMPTASLMKDGRDHAECQVIIGERYDLREHRSEYVDQINNNPPNTNAVDFRYYRIAEYTFSHCY